MSSSYPLLYSFRRCPYAIRARMALYYSQTPVLLREVELKRKPQHMLDISPKGTVPVLQLHDHTVLDESLDVMLWALDQNDPDKWLLNYDAELVRQNDIDFKPSLDRYKYADRYPEQTPEFYRDEVAMFLRVLNQRLENSSYLNGGLVSLTDVAIFPFVRQCAFVDKHWFDQAELPHLQRWLDAFLHSSLFLSVMKKYKPWQEGDAEQVPW